MHVSRSSRLGSKAWSCCRQGGKPIRDWVDLLQPALKGRVAFVDSPREFVGVAFKTLGLPFNASPADVQKAGLSPANVKERVAALRKQVCPVLWAIGNVRNLGCLLSERR